MADVMRLKYIVTGCPRSGTLYMARLLTSLGVPCGHEAIFDYLGMQGAIYKLVGHARIQFSDLSQEQMGVWIEPETIIADSSYCAAPYLEKFPFLKIIHIVREPLKVISSLVQDLGYFKDANPENRWEKFIYEHLPDLRKPFSPIERACLFYVRWNEMVEQTNCYFHHAEDEIDDLAQYLQKEVPPDAFNDRTANKLGKRTYDYALTDIPDGEIKDRFVAMRSRYRYE